MKTKQIRRAHPVNSDIRGVVLIVEVSTMGILPDIVSSVVGLDTMPATVPQRKSGNGKGPSPGDRNWPRT